MSIYKFLDNEERLTKKEFGSFKEAQKFAKENELTCLTFGYKEFVPAFEEKVQRLAGHYNYAKLAAMAEEAVRKQSGVGHDAIAADDFMRRIIEMPVAYIADWLEGKNNLEWLSEHVSERECEGVVTYAREDATELCVKEALGQVLENGLDGVRVYHAQDEDAYRNAIQYWSNSLGEILVDGDLPEPLKRVYEDFDAFEKFVSRVHLVETERGYGVALVNEYDECFANDMHLSMDRLFMSAAVDAAGICSRSEFEGAQVSLAKGLGFDGCHELCVVFPADVKKEVFYKAAEVLDDLAYKSAPELMRAGALLDMPVGGLNVNNRTWFALQQAPFPTIQELLSQSFDDLLKLPGWGKVMVENIEAGLNRQARDLNVPNLRMWAKATVRLERDLSVERSASIDAVLNDAFDRVGSQERSSVFTNKQVDFLVFAINKHLDAVKDGFGDLWWSSTRAETKNSVRVISELRKMAATDGYQVDRATLQYARFAIGQYEWLRDKGYVGTFASEEVEKQMAKEVRDLISKTMEAKGEYKDLGI